jgi:hypothetical protein
MQAGHPLGPMRDAVLATRERMSNRAVLAGVRSGLPIPIRDIIIRIVIECRSFQIPSSALSNPHQL